MTRTHLKGKKVNLRQGVIIIFAAFIIGLTVAEVASRIGNLRRPQINYSFFPSPGLLYGNRVNARWAYDFPIKVISRPPYLETSPGYYEINSWGVRGPELDLATLHQDNHKIILCLGDSTTFGLQVKQFATYPKVLEKLFRESRGPEWTVINAGVPGYDVPDYAAYLKFLISRVHPNIVTVGLCLNDATPRRWSDTVKLILGNFSVFFYNCNHLFDLIDRARATRSWENRLHSQLDDKSIQALKIYVSTTGDVSSVIRSVPISLQMDNWATAVSTLGEMKRLCDQNNIKFVSLIFPLEYQLLFNYEYPEPQKTVQELLAKQGIEVIDMRPVFKAAIQQGHSCFVTLHEFIHFNAYGHFLVAQKLAESLMKGERPANYRVRNRVQYLHPKHET